MKELLDMVMMLPITSAIWMNEVLPYVTPVLLGVFFYAVWKNKKEEAR